MVKVKICGIKRLEDAVVSCECGADYLGLIFVEGTPRCVNKDEAACLVRSLRRDFEKKIPVAGLFLDEDPEKVISAVIECGLDMVQLQGVETPEQCALIKAKTGSCVAKTFRVDKAGGIYGKLSLRDYDGCDFFVFDTFHPGMAGGTGEVFDWKSLVSESSNAKKPFFLAGGLYPGNVGSAVKTLRPYGVDVSSGVEESPGKKDKKKIKEFIENAKEKKFA
ncbi:MAG: phosphoribosylanthranilate isomerase [Candidatus Omnitrophota bacterium]